MARQACLLEEPYEEPESLQHRPVTQQELQEQIQSVAGGLVPCTPESELGQPRWITARELVESLKPYIVYN